MLLGSLIKEIYFNINSTSLIKDIGERTLEVKVKPEEKKDCVFNYRKKTRDWCIFPCINFEDFFNLFDKIIMELKDLKSFYELRIGYLSVLLDYLRDNKFDGLIHYSDKFNTVMDNFNSFEDQNSETGIDKTFDEEIDLSFVKEAREAIKYEESIIDAFIYIFEKCTNVPALSGEVNFYENLVKDVISVNPSNYPIKASKDENITIEEGLKIKLNTGAKLEVINREFIDEFRENRFKELEKKTMEKLIFLMFLKMKKISPGCCCIF